MECVVDTVIKLFGVSSCDYVKWHDDTSSQCVSIKSTTGFTKRRIKLTGDPVSISIEMAGDSIVVL